MVSSFFSSSLSRESMRRKLVVATLCLTVLGGVFSILIPSRNDTATTTSGSGCVESSSLRTSKDQEAHSSPSFALENVDHSFTDLSQSNTGGPGSAVFDFAIVGYPKCATTFLHTYFRTRVPQVYIPRKELCAFYANTTHHDLVSRFYEPYELCDKDPRCGLSSSSHALETFTKLHEQKHKEILNAEIRGFKCPRVLETEDTYPSAIPFFSKTNLIVQIRHPVLWFQSYYNYRSKERYPEELLSPNELVGACDHRIDPYIMKAGLENVRNVCTDRSKFHVSLARLGLTPMQNDEVKLLGGAPMSVHASTGKVFLLEVGQLSQDNQTLSDTFRKDLRKFLGLKAELPPFPSHHKQPEKPSEAKTINICDEEHAKARAALMENGRDAANWIREYFLKSRSVKVTSKEFFLELLDKWDEDPCDTIKT